MNSTLKIAVDCGKAYTKTAYRSEAGVVVTSSFETRFNPNPSERDFLSTGTDSVEVDGKRYAVGPTSVVRASGNTSKAEEIHHVLTMYAVAKICKETGAKEVDLAVGCPLSEISTKEARKAYKKFIAPVGPAYVKINGETLSIRINSVTVCPESFGAVTLNGERFEDDIVGVIDIGGLNINACMFKNLVAMPDTMFTADFGYNVLRSKVKEALMEEYGMDNIMDDLVDQYIEKGHMKNKEDSDEIIKACIHSHFVSILKECKKRGWDMNGVSLVCVGGSSLFFKRALEQKYPDVYIPEDAQYCNVKGFLASIDN